MDYAKIISAAARDMRPSGIRKFFDIAAEMKDCISLGVGEPDFKTPWTVRDAGIRSLEKGRTWYTSNSGLAELREETCNYLSRRMGLSYTPGETVVTVGGSEAIDMCIRALVNPGDEVIIPEPCFVCYYPITTLTGGVPVPLPLKAENGFKLTAQELEAAITPRTKLIIFPFPCNPTGAVMRREDLEPIAALLRDKDIIVLSDEIYAELTYGGERHVSIASLPGMKERTVVVNGFSKAYAMTGWRIGYLAAPADVAKACSKLQGQTTSGTCSVAQKAAEAAYTTSQECVAEMLEAFRRRRDLIVGLCRAIPGMKLEEPQGAFYIFPEVSAFIGRSYTAADGSRKTIDDDNDLAMYLLEEAHVATVAGSAFCLPGYIRLSYAAADDQLVEAMDRIAKALARLS